MILSFRALWSLSTRRGAFPAFSRSEQQTLGQIEPRGSQGVTGKGNNHSHPRVPRAPVVEPMRQCCLA